VAFGWPRSFSVWVTHWTGGHTTRGVPVDVHRHTRSCRERVWPGMGYSNPWKHCVLLLRFPIRRIYTMFSYFSTISGWSSDLYAVSMAVSCRLWSFELFELPAEVVE